MCCIKNSGGEFRVAGFYALMLNEEANVMQTFVKFNLHVKFMVKYWILIK